MNVRYIVAWEKRGGADSGFMLDKAVDFIEMTISEISVSHHQLISCYTSLPLL